MHPARIVGVLLVLVGTGLLVVMTTGIGGEFVVVALGVGFLIGYAVTRRYGLLIPGAILTGLGSGMLAGSAGAPGDWPALGLGLGFLSIAAIDRLVAPPRAGWWWPLIPGGIITIVAGSQFPGMATAGRYVGPVVIIVIGLLLLLRRGEPTPRTPATETAPEPSRDEGTRRRIGGPPSADAPPPPR